MVKVAPGIRPALHRTSRGAPRDFDKYIVREEKHLGNGGSTWHRLDVRV